MSHGPRYVTLRDYMRVVRAHRWMIPLVALVFAAGAYAYSKSQNPTYQAETSISLSDATRDSELFAVPSSFLESPEERADEDATELSTLPVARGVKRALHSRLPAKKLRDAVTIGAEGRSRLVVVQASWGDPAFAARLANTYARVGTARLVREDRQRYAQAARTSLRRYNALKHETKDTFSRAVTIERISRLQGLADFARAARVVKGASVPDAPSSPKPVRDGILGGFLGLILGLLVAFVRDTLDRRVRAPDEIEHAFQLPVLGQVREEALGRVPVSANGRKALDPADLEAFRILRTSLQLLEAEGPRRVVLVTSALPEEGKSTVATALGAAAAGAGSRTLVAECDLRRPTLASRMGIVPEPGLSDVLTGRVSFEQAVQTIALGGSSSGLNGAGASSPASRRPETMDCLTAGSSSPHASEVLKSPRLRDLLDKWSGRYDTVVLDTSPLLPVADTLGLLSYADLVVICVRASVATREEIHATKALLERVPAHLAGLVVTGLRASDAAAYGYYPYAYDYAGSAR